MSDTDKDLPMLDGPSIPWSLAEKIYERYANRYGKEQSLKRLAERGGFGWAEVPFLFKSQPRIESRGQYVGQQSRDKGKDT